MASWKVVRVVDRAGHQRVHESVVVLRGESPEALLDGGRVPAEGREEAFGGRVDHHAHLRCSQPLHYRCFAGCCRCCGEDGVRCCRPGRGVWLGVDLPTGLCEEGVHDVDLSDFGRGSAQFLDIFWVFCIAVRTVIISVRSVCFL